MAYPRYNRPVEYKLDVVNQAETPTQTVRFEFLGEACNDVLGRKLGRHLQRRASSSAPLMATPYPTALCCSHAIRSPPRMPIPASAAVADANALT